ncbi:hypothetical protein ACIHCQ_41855 [Streptomyces sp. NPDC052236]|uniref:hypothetical protein n=1 Tax=Streptomyces sp. NPDC052236 TaxID=3365686 RepID=UPI0037D781A4
MSDHCRRAVGVLFLQRDGCRPFTREFLPNFGARQPCANITAPEREAGGAV